MTEMKRVEAEAEQEQDEWQQASKAANRGDYEDEIPVDVLIKIGIESGICQFCGRMLTHSESKVRGYGPTCASKNGLPWSAGSGEAYSNDGVSQSLLAEVGAE